MSDKTQLAIIGAGPGGYPAAFRAADLGMDVTLIDPEPNPGGVCLFRGCIPSKVLLHATTLLAEIQEGGQFGIHCDSLSIDPKALRKKKDEVVQQLTKGVGSLCKSRKVNYVQGRARFEKPGKLTLTTDDGERSLAYEQAIIATGSLPVILPFLPESDLVMTSREALEVDDPPERLLVIGGGYIGLELGQVYAGIGSTVTVVEMMSQLLPSADPDIVRVLKKRLDKQFDSILLDTKVNAVDEASGKLKVQFEDKDGDSFEDAFDKLIVAVGRSPNYETVNLDAVDIEPGEDGFIPVDHQMRTIRENIFAIGDIAGQPMLAHKATHEGLVAAEAAAGENAAADWATMPAVVFTDPEVAWCGKTERQARDMGHNVRIGKFPWSASGRALTLGRTDGLTKVVVDDDSGLILGGAAVGYNAGELIGQMVLAMEMGAVIEDLALTSQTHPSLSETVMEAARDACFGSIHAAKRSR